MALAIQFGVLVVLLLAAVATLWGGFQLVVRAFSGGPDLVDGPLMSVPDDPDAPGPVQRDILKFNAELADQDRAVAWPNGRSGS